MKPIALFFSSLLFFFLLASTAAAQTDWMRQSPEESFSIEYLQPKFIENSYDKLSGSVVILSGRWNVSDATKLVVEIPYATTTEEYAYSNYSFDPNTGSYYYNVQTSKKTKSGVSSIGFGAEFGSTASSSSGRLMLQIPVLARDNSMAGYVGFLGDFRHFERYITESAFLHGGYHYHPLLAGNIRMYVSVEPMLWFPTSGRGGDTEAILDYAGGAGFDNGTVKAGIGIGSRWVLTEDRAFGTTSTLYHLVAELGFRIGSLEPAVSFTRQLDRALNSTVKNTLGFRMRLLF